MTTQPCPKCGKPWIQWLGKDPLPCHAKCYLSEELQDDIYWLKQTFHQASNSRLARDFKIPLGVLYASLEEAARRAGKKTR